MPSVLNLPLFVLRGVRDFLLFWYIRGSREFWRWEKDFIAGVEREVGILINLKLITQPIFGDYTRMGEVIGPIFRLGRVLLGCFLVLVSLAGSTAVYALWLSLPPLSFVMTLDNLSYILFR